MKFSFTSRDLFSQKSPASVLFTFENERPDGPPALQRFWRSLNKKEFSGRKKQVLLWHTGGNPGPDRLLLAGLGPRAKFTAETMRQTTGQLVQSLRQAGLAQVMIAVRDADHLAPLAETLLLAGYQFTEFKAPADRAADLKQVTFCLPAGIPTAEARRLVTAARITAEAANYARDIGNRPGNIVYPAVLAGEAQRLARSGGLKCTILDKPALRRRKFGGLLAVGSGSAHDPRLIVLEYKPTRPRNRQPVALVGKAITFDSGGLSLKPGAKMDEMKFDKCGGVAVLGAMRSIAKRRLPVHVIGVIASAENLPSNTSYRPGDVVTSYRGTDKRAVTIEVLNTDAEGRIVLGDALVYARQQKPAAIIDLATLTGACVIALGEQAAGLMGNDERLQDKIRAAGETTGERVWPLPLWDGHRDQIKSHVADHRNIGGREGGALTAAAFLSRYVGSVPWAHLDIAGTAWTTKDRDYLEKGATGFGVRLLTELLSRWR